MKTWFWVVCLCLGMIGCQTGGGPAPAIVPLPVKVLSSSLHCRPASGSWTVTLVDSPAMLELMASKIDAHLIGTSSKKLPPVNLEDGYVIAVEMGRQPTAGFGIDPKKVSATVTDRTVILRISWHGPAVDVLVPQVVTSPCLFVFLARGSYDQILVKDQKDMILGKLAPGNTN